MTTHATAQCESCGTYRKLRHPGAAGRMCRGCAAGMASAAAVPANTRPPIDRFAEKVATSELDDCWHWIATCQPNGYGAFGSSGVTHRAHRWSYEHFVGPIPDGLPLDHLCRNRACVNPEHLEPVTHQVNTRRAMRAACVNGHDFSPENTWMHKGKRYCRTCRRTRVREYRLRRTEGATT